MSKRVEYKIQEAEAQVEVLDDILDVETDPKWISVYSMQRGKLMSNIRRWNKQIENQYQ